MVASTVKNRKDRLREGNKRRRITQIHTVRIIHISYYGF